MNDFTTEEVEEMAQAYISLLDTMTGVLAECDTKYGFFWQTPAGFGITGHPPEDLVAAIKHPDTRSLAEYRADVAP